VVVMSSTQRIVQFLLSSALVLCSVTGALGLAEWLFVKYENARFSAHFVDQGGKVNLRALNYADTVIAVEKPANEFRVLSFGDSFAYSIMAYDYSYSGVAARALNSASGYPVVRIVNLGEPATSVYDYLAACQYWSAALHPDALLFNIFLGNDLLDIAFQYVPSSWVPNRINGELDFHMADGSRRSHVPHRFSLRLLDYAYAYYLQYRYASAPVTKKFWLGDVQIALGDVPEPHYSIAATHALPEDVYFDTNKEQMVNFDATQLEQLRAGYRAVYALLQFASERIAERQPVLITLAPNEPQVDATLLSQLAERYHLDLSRYDLTLPARVIMALRDLVDARIPVIDLTGYFQCHSGAGEKLYYHRNTHWNLEGNALAGMVIALTMQRLWFSPAVGLPAALAACAEEKIATYRKVSDEAIRAYVTTQLLPSIEADVSAAGR
jgi:hypothetical protein